MPIKSLIQSFKLDRWTRIAISIAILVYLSVICLSLFFPDFDFRITLLVVGLVYLGMPHGAMDIYLISKLTKTKSEVVLILTFYILLTLGILLLWVYFPTLSFIIFILYSMLHFADSDIQKEVFKNKLNTLEFLARLPLPFCVPLIFFKTSILDLIYLLHPKINFLPFVTVFQFFGYLGIFLTLIFVLISFYLLVTNFKSNDLSFLEPVVLIVLFSQITPLYAFGIYFCFIHGIKHIINVVRKIEIKSFKTLLPYWLLPLLGLPVLLLVSALSSSYRSELLQMHLFQYILITLSALALPHSLLVRHCKNLKLID